MDSSILVGMAISIGIMIFFIAVAFAIVIFAIGFAQPEFLCELCIKNCSISDIIILP